MGAPFKVALCSDIHYASAAEQARGNDYELRIVRSAPLRLLLRFYRAFVWARDPLHRGHLLDEFLQAAEGDIAVVGGDLTCDTGFQGLSDPAAFQSGQEVLQKLRGRFGHDGVRVAWGDHDLGKHPLLADCGGMRLESCRRLKSGLGLPEFWRVDAGAYALIGVASSLLAFPAFQSEALDSEMQEWLEMREAHVRDIAAAFKSLPARARVLLFCHDPTALPFLLEIGAVRSRLAAIEHTYIGHLHSRLILAKSKLLAGMPHIRFMGHTVSKLSSALRKAREWRAFNIVLCPALAGIELLKDGGFLEITLDTSAEKPAAVRFRPLRGKEQR